MKHYQPVIGALSDCISVVENNGIKIINVNHSKATASVSLHGAHVLSFKPAGQQEVLWLSEKAQFDHEKALRGGIPVCWPWFGRIASPAHGFARTSQWHLVEHKESDSGVIICLGLEESDETLAIWPYCFQVRLYVEVSDSLKVTLDVRNTDDKPWNFSGALHSYFNVADIAETAVTGMGQEYRDSLLQDKLCSGEKELTLSNTIDRVYTQPESEITIHDSSHNRSIVITNQGHNCAVIWNPWQQGAEAMADMADDGYQTMLCVESTYHAASLEQGKTLQPEENYRLVTEIQSHPKN